MSIEFRLSVVPIDANGEVVLEVVEEPRFAVAECYVWELFDATESARYFAEVVAGLDLRWYRQTTMETCVAEGRNPTAADCFRPCDVRRDLELIRARLADMESRLPRKYRFQKSTRLDEWLSGSHVFYGGRLFSVHADWDVCKATWWVERPTHEAIYARLGTPDIEHDLRLTAAFHCVEAVRQDGGFVPGGPITLRIGEQTPRDHFEPYLTPIVDFCTQAEAGGFLVYTSRG